VDYPDHNHDILIHGPNGICKDNCLTICNIVYDKTMNCMVILGKQYIDYYDIYPTPCKSSTVDCYLLKSLSFNKQIWPIENIKYKYLALPL